MPFRPALRLLPLALALLTVTQPAHPQTPAPTPLAPFDTAANAALAAMRARATGLNISGVAVVAFFTGDTMQAWQSKAAVVGRIKDAPTADSKGNNLLAIAYAKASEMADTLQNSGTASRPPMTGEFGWTGGVIRHTKSGFCIAAFSGGKSEDDVKVSQTGVETLGNTLEHHP